MHWIRNGLIAIAGVGAVVAALSSVPGLVDVEAYKPGLIQAVREATGRELVIDGPMRLRMFPVPGIGAGTVRFANAVGATGAQMINVRWVSVRPDWRALLRGQIAVGTLTLYQPTIVLETDARGVPNWEFKPGGNESQKADQPSEGFHLAVGRLEIVRGTISYTDPATKTHYAAENVEAGATVRSFDGPFEIDGSATVNGVPLKLDMAFGAATQQGHAARLNLKVSSGDLDFKGFASALSLDAKLAGHLTVKTGVLSDFVNSVLGAVGGDKANFDVSGAGRFAFDGDVEIGPERLVLGGFEASMGKDAARGSLALALKPSPALSGNVSLSRLEIDKWIKIFARPSELVSPANINPVKAAAGAPSPEVAAAKVTTAVVGPSPWTRLDADVTVEIAEAIYNNAAIRDLSASFDMRKGVPTVSRLKATMPGDLAIDADAAKGTFNASAGNLRQSLEWLGVKTTGVPRGALESFSATGKLAAKAGGLDLSDGTFRLDGTKGTLGGTLFLKAPMTATLAVGMERFDLDAYMPRPSGTPAPAAAPPPPPPPASAARPDGAPSIGLALDIKQLQYRGETMNGVVGKATWQGNVLKLEDIQVADLLGSKLGLRGHVDDVGTVPRFDLAFTVASPDTDKLLDYMGLPKFMNGRIGPGTAQGSVAGTREAVTVRDLAAHLLDTDARVAGQLGFAKPVSFDFRTFALDTPDAGKFVSVASGRETGALGPLRAAGALKGTVERAVFTGDLAVRGSDMNGTLDATLGKRPKLVAKLNVPRTLAVDTLLGIEDDSAPPPLSPDEAPSETRHAQPARRATDKPINLTALRSFDAALVVSAKAMSMAALTVDYADLDATLQNGVFRINKLTGQFYKAAVDFTGTIDASGQALAIEANGSLLGMHVDELLRGTMGDNIFGKSSSYGVVVGGKVDARNIRLTGRGVSGAQLRESISGATTVSGTVRASMASGAQSFAQFATGIGSIFSDTLAFDSAVLNAFVNHENAVSAGGVALGGGTVTLTDVTVHGNNAVAVISGQNRMAEGTTDTTIRLNTGNRGYVARMTGKLSSPNLHADSQ
ncbi:MAG: AsmA family protein [Proteobacteria bacterium]|nr:AsmA family protein [Pseudomonadota bacterium]